MAEVVDFTGVTRLDLRPERVLEAALKVDLTQVVVLGYDQDGGEYFASSIAGGPEVVWLLERAKKRLLEIGDDDG